MTSIIALYKKQNILVSIVDEPYQQGNETLVPVKALKGTPFADGAKCTTRTAFKTVNTKELQPFKSDSSLLQRALTFKNKRQWYAGEAIWLHSQAFLKEQSGQIHLCLVGKACSLPVYHFDPDAGSWRPCHNLESNYTSWAQAVRK